jgi:hypothetical protein
MILKCGNRAARRLYFTSSDVASRRQNCEMHPAGSDSLKNAPVLIADPNAKPKRTVLTVALLKLCGQRGWAAFLPVPSFVLNHLP